jgi:hydrogenase expression/formation protein HypD
VKLARRNATGKSSLPPSDLKPPPPRRRPPCSEADRLKLDNFSILASHKLIMPAMRALLESGDVRVDGFLCPGHVAVIIGAAVFEPIVSEYHLPCVIAGFEGPQIAAALARLTELVADGRPPLENLYSQAVTEEGNQAAQAVIDKFSPRRLALARTGRAERQRPGSSPGIRPIRCPRSASSRDARRTKSPRLPLRRCHHRPRDARRLQIVRHRLHARARAGPCMVSSEGTCQAWFKYHRVKIAERLGAS